MNRTLFSNLFVALFVTLSLTACHVAPKAEDRATFTSEAKIAKQWFDTNVKGFTKQVDGSGGYIVFPSVGQAGLMFTGGTFGRGAVHNASGQQIGWAALRRASLGLQLGAQAYKMTIVLQDEGTLNKFKEGKWTGDVSATAVVANEGMAAAGQFSEGVVVYVGDQAGLMAGISIALANVRYKNLDDVE